MNASALPLPVALPGAIGRIYGTFHAGSQGGGSRTGVLIVPPWGWDEIASYRSRRAWAEELASRGLSTLRIDLPATGDSDGDPREPALVHAWVDAVRTSADWLRDDYAVDRVVAVSLGLGGLLTLEAISRGAAIDELVAWATPAAGRAWVREQRAFAAMQSARLEGPGNAQPPALPDGWLEVGGFVLSEATIDAIQGLTPAPVSGTRLRRALVLDRDGMGTDAGLLDRLRAASVDVQAEAGPGWSSMVFHPEQYAPPMAVFEQVGTWIREGDDGAVPARTADRAPVPSAEASGIHDGGTGIGETERVARAGAPIETPVWIDQPFGRIFGILTARASDAGPSGADLCAIFLNAGAVRRVGPNRMWVETARRWAALGVPSIRMDLEGIGDADGDPNRFLDVGNFYTEAFGAQVGAILDELERRGLGPRFVLVGLCAGGYWAFHTSARDRRVVAALILNPRAMIWDSGLLARRDAQDAGRILRAGTWQRVLKGDVPVRRAAAVLRALATRAWSAAARRIRLAPADVDRDPTALLDAVRDHGARMVVAFSGDEPVHDELARDGVLGQMERWPNLAVERLPGRDHTLRPVAAQRAAAELLDRELFGLLGSAASSTTRVPGRPAPPLAQPTGRSSAAAQAGPQPGT